MQVSPSKETFLWEADETEFLPSIVNAEDACKRSFSAVNWESFGIWQNCRYRYVTLSKIIFAETGERVKVKKIENKI